MFFVGPGVFFLTPTHPLLARERNLYTGEDGALHEIEAAKPITVEDNVWLGGGGSLTPGVTIGHDAVIGAGQRRYPGHSRGCGRRRQPLQGPAPYY